MKTYFSTRVLVLVFLWKLNGEVTLSLNTTSQPVIVGSQDLKPSQSNQDLNTTTTKPTDGITPAKWLSTVLKEHQGVNHTTHDSTPVRNSLTQDIPRAATDEPLTSPTLGNKVLTKSPTTGNKILTKKSQEVSTPLTDTKNSTWSSQGHESKTTKATTITLGPPSISTRNEISVNTTDAQTNSTVHVIGPSSIKANLPPTTSKTPTGTSTGPILTVNTSKATAFKTTRGTDTTATTTEEKSLTQNHQTTFTTKSGQTKNTKSNRQINSDDPNQDQKEKGHPGAIVATLIGMTLVLMFIAIAVILVKNHRTKKHQMMNTDWAGPSPFLEGGIESNLPGLHEDGPFKRRESKRISLHSFLPQRLSKRLSLLKETDEFQMGDVPAYSSFGENKQPESKTLNGKPIVVIDQSENLSIEDASAAPEASSESAAQETTEVSDAAVTIESTQPTADNEDKTIPSPTLDMDVVIPPPPQFEDVDLDAPLEGNTAPTSPSDALDVPAAPPLP